MPEDSTLITPAESPADPFAELLGQQARGCWLGYGSVLFLEFGDHVGPNELRHHESGEWSLWSDEILWRIEQGDRVLAGSEDGRPVQETAIQRLDGHVLISGQICGITGDSVLKFSDDLVLRTFVLTSEEDARWNFKHAGGETRALGAQPAEADARP